MNAPDYLFVSTNVARAFPSLMESLIVQSYRTPLPGESAKQWRMSRWQRFLYHIQTARRGNIFLRLSVTVSTTAWALLEYGATAPYLLQKMFVLLCQPFLVSGIGLAFYLVIESPLYITLFFLGAMVAISFANRRRLAKLAARRLVAVTPLPPSSAVNTSTEGEMRIDIESDDKELSISYSITSESVVSATPSSFPSPLNSSEEGSFYNSFPDCFRPSHLLSNRLYDHQSNHLSDHLVARLVSPTDTHHVHQLYSLAIRLLHSPVLNHRYSLVVR